MGVRWVKVAAQFFHEDPDRAAHVRNRGVDEAKHEGYIIAATALERVAVKRRRGARSRMRFKVAPTINAAPASLRYLEPGRWPAS